MWYKNDGDDTKMSLKESNEITVKIKGSIDDLYRILEDRNYKIIDKFNMDDYYFIPECLEIEKMSTREILTKAILVRNIYDEINKKYAKIITFKIKKFDNKGNILKQEAIDCNIFNTEDAKKLLKAIGYREIMNIKEKDIVYEKDGVPLAIKDISNGDNLIEIETLDRDGFRTIEELKEKIIILDIPIETNNYFVKKAEIELDKILNRKNNIN